MSVPLQANKRIISKGKYVALIGKKIGLALGSAGLAILTSFCTVVAFVSIFATPVCLSGGSVAVGIILPFVAILFFWISSRLLQAAEHGMAQAQKEEYVLPLTRANLIHLPATESLVRASDKPAEQQDVLLRAATQGQETPVEELLRPAGGQESP